jgi:hypothetical protein
VGHQCPHTSEVLEALNITATNILLTKISYLEKPEFYGGIPHIPRMGIIRLLVKGRRYMILE